MGLDRTRWCELLVGLDRVAILEVARGADGRVHVAVETTERAVGCGACGARASLKGRRRVPLADLPTFAPVSLGRARWASARCCTPVARYARRPPLRATSSEIVHR